MRVLPSAKAALRAMALARFGEQKTVSRIVEELVLLRTPYERVRVNVAICVDDVVYNAIVSVKLNLATRGARVVGATAPVADGARMAPFPHAILTRAERREAIRRAWEEWDVRRVRAGLEGS